MTTALRQLANIGPAMARDLELLGITSVEALARTDADTLYLRLQTLTGSDQDPCVWTPSPPRSIKRAREKSRVGGIGRRYARKDRRPANSSAGRRMPSDYTRPLVSEAE